MRKSDLCHTYVRGDAKKVVEVGCSHEGTLPKGIVPSVVIKGMTIQSAEDATFDHIELHGSTVMDSSGEPHWRSRYHRGGHGSCATL